MQADPLASQQAEFRESYVPANDGVKLRVLSWRPRGPERADPLLFVAGWVSVVDGWADLLRALVVDRQVHYLETREKGSAQLDARDWPASSFGIEQMASDILGACAALGLDVGRTVVAGSSLGASGLLESMKKGKLAPRAAFLIAPNACFHYPRWASLVLHLPANGYHVFKYPLLWWLRSSRVKEPEQMRRYEKTLLAAHPQRIKASAIAIRDYRIWPDLETVRAPVALAYAESDTLHGAGEIARMAEAIPGARTIPCPSNKHMHSAALKPQIDAFLEALRLQAVG